MNIKKRVALLIERLQDRRVMRAVMRYSTARGSLLAGGVAYSALFAMSAALTICWSIFMATLGRNFDLRETVVHNVNAAIPGILKDSTGEGIIDPDTLIVVGGSWITTIIAIAVLVWSAISVMDGLGIAISAMFGINTRMRKSITNILANCAGFTVLAVSIAASSFISAMIGKAGTFILEFIGVGDSSTRLVLKHLLFLGAIVIDAALIMFIIRYVGNAHVPIKDFIAGALIGGLLLTVVRSLGTTVVASVSRNPFLAPFAALAAILFWFNLASRILLFTAAFMANPPRLYVPEEHEELHMKSTPNYVTRSVPESLGWPHDPLTGALLPYKPPKDDDVGADSQKQGEATHTSATLNGSGAILWGCAGESGRCIASGGQPSV
ncbi:YihY/virulence factor BrkB family protein [Actinotignum urinale]|uniref:YihY/virulence factor BrkB family protein n=1 Tax=Actinotignum urinale TaxID=190146 RepID=A0ABU5G5M6_9ACTO|nr:YihY/virulence factor BrkB family protein [Actinotignum urinale]MDY5132496.1 YihY/virulence factor BrkB family protein [Actinotignum urinale]MDY5151077.1 YihY/virulence factor BrkB family protein [Actinotignum urinale]MDY5159942.1 YihY/virulence factor BrkB family protein [Actinotignum urinale]WIK58689.1 YihY/virulence factor BrkB family protein [Actinotignum urinale]